MSTYVVVIFFAFNLRHQHSSFFALPRFRILDPNAPRVTTAGCPSLRSLLPPAPSQTRHPSTLVSRQPARLCTGLILSHFYIPFSPKPSCSEQQGGRLCVCLPSHRRNLNTRLSRTSGRTLRDTLVRPQPSAQ